MKFHFDPDEGLIVVPTKIWGPKGDSILRLALDTGAKRLTMMMTTMMATITATTKMTTR